MAILTGLFRLGRDAEKRYTQSGDAVVSVALAYNYGKKVDGKRPTQWVDAAIFGKMGEALEPYLKKGQQISATIRDVNVRTYEKKDKSTGFSLSGTIQDIELAGGRSDEPKTEAKSAPKTEKKSPFDDFESDIPF